MRDWANARLGDWMMMRLVAVLASVVLVACSGGGGGTPTGPTPTPNPTAFTTNARIIDAVTGAALTGVSASAADIGGGPSTTAGMLTVGSATGTSAARTVTFTRSGYVSRVVNLKIPGNEVTVSMIPSTFNLDAFDELLRVVRLQRWTTPPPLRVQSRTVQFTSTGQAEATALTDVMTDSEHSLLLDDLTWALERLTGTAFQSFASVTRDTIAPGERMTVLNSGVITVARYEGLTAATGFWGYSRWQFRTDGTVVSGTVMLDDDFDRSGSVFRRSLRAHELGHALGYTHVTLLPSVMNSNARIEPNAFDQDSTVIAFRRPPGNIRPDSDPTDVSLNALDAIWHRGEGAGPGAKFRSPKAPKL